MKLTGFSKRKPLRAMNGPPLTPSPRIKRSSKSSATVLADPAIVIASRFHTLAIPVATISRVVAPSKCTAVGNGSRPKVSGNHSTL